MNSAIVNITSILIVTGTILNTVSCKSPASPRQDCVDTLQQAIVSANSIFIKVHAGEALVANGFTDEIEETFSALRQTNLTGSTRVLARLYMENNPAKFEECISTIIDQYLHADSSHPRLVALESLGKLGYSKPGAEIEEDAKNGEGGFKAMARWVLSNNGAKETEDSLAALLNSPEVAHHRGAAYAIRFKKSISDKTFHLLEQCAARIANTETHKVYILSAIFVHAPADKKQAAKNELLKQAEGPVAAKYETCEALSINGDTGDMPLLETLLKDEDQDVRVAAANAILKIQKRAE
jgi:hypothetical protein